MYVAEAATVSTVGSVRGAGASASARARSHARARCVHPAALR